MIRSTQILAACAILAAAIIGTTAEVAADIGNYNSGRADAASNEGGGKITAHGPSTLGTTNKGGAPTVKDCMTVSLNEAVYTGFGPTYDHNFVLSAERPVGYQTCTRISDGSEVSEIVWWSPPGPTASDAVAIAESELHLELPDIATSPPRGGLQLVGVPIWFWSVGAKPVSTTAAIPGLAATLTATPTGTRIRIGGGAGQARVDNVTLDCPDGGRPWQRGRDGAWANSGCSHAFVWNETFTVTATITWELAWTATNGQAGTLPDVARTTSFTLDLDQAQAVTD